MASPFTVADWSARFLSGRFVSTFENWDDLLEHTQTICTDVKSYEETKPESEFDLLPVILYSVTHDASLTYQTDYLVKLSKSETGFYGERRLGPATIPLSKVIRGVIGATGILLEDIKDDVTGKIETVSDVIEKIARDYCTRNGHYDEKAEIDHNYSSKTAQIAMDVMEEIEQNRIKYYARQEMLDEILASLHNVNLFKQGETEGKEIDIDFIINNPINVPARTENYNRNKLEESVKFGLENLYKVLEKDTLIPDDFPKIDTTSLNSMFEYVWNNWLKSKYYYLTGHRLAIEITFTKNNISTTYDYTVQMNFKDVYTSSNWNPTLTGVTPTDNNYLKGFKLGAIQSPPTATTLTYTFNHGTGTEIWQTSTSQSSSFTSSNVGVGIIDSSSVYTGRAFRFILAYDTFMTFETKPAKYKKYPNSIQPSTNKIESSYPNWYNNKVDTSAIATREGQQVITTIPYIPLGINNVDDGYPVTQNPSATQSGFPAKTEKLDDITYPPIDIPQNPSIDIPAVDSTTDITNDKADIKNPAIPIAPTADLPLEELPTPILPPLPSLGGAGLGTIYNPSSSELSAVKGVLWNESVIQTIKNIFTNNPMDAILSSSICFANPSIAGTKEIKLGYYDTNVNSNYITNQYTSINCGTVAVNEVFNNYMDYEPYTTVGVYLPFVGIRELNANDIIGKSVSIEYRCDVVTGSCVAIISVTKNDVKQILYTFEGNCSIDLPITASSFNITGMLSGVGGMTAGLLSKNAMSFFQGALNTVSSVAPSVLSTGSLGGNAGALIGKKPFIIIKRIRPANAYNFNSISGFPANKYIRLGNCGGYTRVRDCHVDGIRCTDTEKEMIYNAITTGVII